MLVKKWNQENTKSQQFVEQKNIYVQIHAWFVTLGKLDWLRRLTDDAEEKHCGNQPKVHYAKLIKTNAPQ